MNTTEENADSGASQIPGPYLSPEQTESFPLKQALYGGNRRVSKDCCSCWDRDENSGLRVIVICFFVLSLIITVALAAQIYFGDYQLVPHGSVATDSHFCSVIGTDILKQGGNAVDAAVASTICMGVVQPHVTGLGGGGFALVYNHQKKVVLDVIDFREVSPENYNLPLDKKVSEVPDASVGHDIGVPGLVRGLGLIHALHGKLKWRDLIIPSVLLARNGFQVPQSLTWAWTRITGNLKDNPRLQDIFSSLEAGQNLTLPRLADALEKIAIFGPDDIYNGTLATSLLQTLSQTGSNITLDDLKRYSPRRRKALKVKFSDYEVLVPDAPSGGPLLMATIELLKKTNITDFEETIGVLASKLGNVYDTHKGIWGDPDFKQNYAQMSGNAWNFPEAVASPVAAVDLNDLYVAVVSGLNTWFGSQIITDYQFILNNALKNFDVGNNIAGPKKRPLSLAVPVIVTQSGEVCGQRLVLGAGNSAAAAQLLTNLLLLHQNISYSIEAPRFHFMPLNKLIGFEEGLREPSISNATLTFLQQEGFKLQKLPKPYQSCNIVEKIGDILSSHSDSRGGGVSSRF